MAILKQRLHRKNSNDYDIIHYETSSSICLRQNGEAIENSLNNLPKLKDNNNDPTTMFTLGEIQISPNGTIFIGHNNGIDVYSPNQIYNWKKYNTISIIIYYWGRYNLQYSYTENDQYSRRFFEGNKAYYIQHGDRSIVNDGSGPYYKWSESPEISYTPSHWNYGNTITEYSNKPTSCYILGQMGDGVSGGRYWSCTKYTIGNETISIGDYINDVSSSSRNMYPDNGRSGSYWYIYDRNETTYSQGSYIEDVYSADPNAYPANGKHTDGYWYVKQ